MNSEAMEQFRRRYRQDISSRYNGWVHMLSVAIVGIIVIAFSLREVTQVTLLELSCVQLTLVLVNFAEYYAHRWLGHKRTKLGGLFYKRHTGDHHSFFLETDMDYQSTRDWRVVLFPAYLIFAFILGLALPIGYVFHELLSPNTGYLFAASAIGGYLFYEVMHFSFHIPQGHWAEKMFLYIPGWKTMRLSHTIHHQRNKMAKVNFNITLPIFDKLLGTWELE